MLRSFLTAGLLITVAACNDTPDLSKPVLPVGLRVDGSDLLSGTPSTEGPYERFELGGGYAADVNLRGEVIVVDGPRSFLWYRGQRQDLGTLGGSQTMAADLNERGQVAGASQAADGSWHAFLWTAGTMQDLGPRNALLSNSCSPFAIPQNISPQSLNDRGDVVWTVGPSGATRVMLWRDGAAQDIGTLGGPFSAASAINEVGQIAGLSALAGESQRHLFLWENGVMRDLGATPGGAVRGLSEQGRIIMTGNVSNPFPETHAFLWDGTATRDLNPASNGFPGGINALGQVALTTSGSSSFESNTAFLWDGSARLLGGNSTALVLNDSGTVAGYTLSADKARVTVWSGDSTWQLEPPAPQFESQTMVPRSINNHGDVAGDHKCHAALWRRMHPVTIDVRRSGRLTAVALVSSAALAAADVDPVTVTFGGAASIRQATKDVNRDGLPDVLHYFESQALQLPEGTTEACLRGETLGGKAIRGCAAIRVK